MKYRLISEGYIYQFEEERQRKMIENLLRDRNISFMSYNVVKK